MLLNSLESNRCEPGIARTIGQQGSNSYLGT